MTEEISRLRNLSRSGVAVAEIALQLGRSPIAVEAALRRHDGLRRPRAAGFWAACSVRGDTVHARRDGERVAVCGEENVNPESIPFDAASAWSCRRCVRSLDLPSVGGPL